MARQQAGARPKKARAKKKTATGGTVQAHHGSDFIPPGPRGRRGRSSEGAGEAAGVPAISNYRPPSGADTDLFKKFAARAEGQMKQVKKAQDTVKSELGTLSQIYREAKEAGVPAERVRILKQTIKERNRDASEILVEERERAFQHTALKSKLADVMPFSMLMAPPSLTEIEMMGEHAGKNGEPADNNTFTPGTKQFASWHSGWKKGQRDSAAKVFGSDDKGGQGDGSGDEPARDTDGKVISSNVVRLN